MKNLKIFPKMFLQTFGILGTVIVLIHLLVYFIFPITYLETRKQELYSKADEISNNIKGKDLKFVEQSLEFFSKNSDIKAVIKGENRDGEVQIGDNINVNTKSGDNSLIIEEKEVELKNGKKISVQYISTADMKKNAKELSFKFLPYSLAVSFIFSIIVSLIYAKAITNNIKEIKNATKKMMHLDRTAYLKINSTNEVGELKEQINDLYSTLLKLIDDLELKNEEIVKLEKLKYDFFRGTSHELKTPLASLKIILENMKYNIGKYKNRDLYIENCIDIVDHLTRSISQMLSVSSFEHLKNDEEIIVVNDILEDVLKQYILLANNRNIKVNNNLKNEKIYIGMTALKIVLSNLINNAVKYSDENGVINIGKKDDWLYIENSYGNNKISNMDKIFDVKFDLNKENSNGLGLYIVSNILNNYNIEYEALQDEEFFIFKIKCLLKQDIILQ
ncbi:HAMP domain-containing sensor histidine kinase [Actinotignum urinale]|uniref:HAMP domain-containing sensor histidine kinase n=1 Tax=Actinotignum urinale TaxID=190146 RepID=UPI0003B7359F|nr:HAMP domain-containing sensor histidine kinase [Actinotignum urinale]MDY5128770.1 HAMP domain-containing sensor histidine kinase [Actinotignum urinale]MDY5160193.1 HAMP domain-containing sensor histidine kinase [Actinotignum urinale]